MKNKVFYSICISVFFFSCAYYNTFYNAKRYYKSAYQATRENRTGKLSSAERKNYQKAVEKALRLIDLYPESKYVDDALLILGKSYYYQEDYRKARRRFVEIQTEHPKSEHVVAASLWIAKTDLALDQLFEAEKGFRELLGQKIPDRFKGEAYYYLGKLHEERQEFEEAIQAFQQAIEAGVEELEAEVLFAMGADYDSLRAYDKAAKIFQKVLERDPTEELRFEAQFRYGQMLKNLGQFDEGINTFGKLLGDEKNEKKAPDIRLEIAECLALKGEIDDAITAYQDITEDHQRTEQSATAHFMLGRLFEEHYRDYERALENFELVSKEYGRSLYADSAKVKIRDIQRFQALVQVIEMASKGKEGKLMLIGEEVEEDTLLTGQLYTMMESASSDSARYELLVQSGGEVFADSVKNELAAREDEKDYEIESRLRREGEETGVDWIQWLKDGTMPSFTELEQEMGKLENRLEQDEKKKIAENPELKTFNVEELDKNLFFLAELYLFRFFLPDSAANQYRHILDQFPDSPYAARALYNLGYITSEILEDSAGADSIYRTLIERYPYSNISNAARQILNLPLVEARQDSVQRLFGEAEQILFDDNDPMTAFMKYGTLWEKFPDSELAPKAAYSMGWIAANRLDSLSLAFVLYDSLIQKYPESVYAINAKKKVQAVRTEEKKKERQKEEEKRSEEEQGQEEFGEEERDEEKQTDEVTGEEEGAVEETETVEDEGKDIPLKPPVKRPPDKDTRADSSSVRGVSEPVLKDSSGIRVKMDTVSVDSSGVKEKIDKTSADTSSVKKEGKTVSADSSNIIEKPESVPADTSDIKEGAKTVPVDSSSLREETNVVPADSSGITEKQETVSVDTSGIQEDVQTVPADSSGIREDTEVVPVDSTSIIEKQETVPVDISDIQESAHEVPADSSGILKITETVTVDSTSISRKVDTVSVDTSSIQVDMKTVPDDTAEGKILK